MVGRIDISAPHVAARLSRANRAPQRHIQDKIEER
jgi:hypothetical protein